MPCFAVSFAWCCDPSGRRTLHFACLVLFLLPSLFFPLLSFLSLSLPSSRVSLSAPNFPYRRLSLLMSYMACSLKCVFAGFISALLLSVSVPAFFFVFLLSRLPFAVPLSSLHPCACRCGCQEPAIIARCEETSVVDLFASCYRFVCTALSRGDDLSALDSHDWYPRKRPLLGHTPPTFLSLLRFVVSNGSACSLTLASFFSATI